VTGILANIGVGSPKTLRLAVARLALLGGAVEQVCHDDRCVVAVTRKSWELDDDFSGADAAGAGYWDMATWNGRRSSTSLRYVEPNRNRPNLDIVAEALYTKVEFDGKTATGVVYNLPPAITSKVEIVSCASLLGDAIKRLHAGGSINRLLNPLP